MKKFWTPSASQLILHSIHLSVNKNTTLPECSILGSEREDFLNSLVALVAGVQGGKQTLMIIVEKHAENDDDF